MVRESEKIIVIGGGLAGLSASVKILEGGYSGDLVLLEKSPSVGGRTGSVDYRGRILDLGQHMHVSGFDFYLRFLDLIGLSEDLMTQSRLDVEFRDKSGNVGRVRSNRLPPPFHLLSATYNFPFISSSDKLSLVGPVVAALAFGSEDEENDRSFGDWLREKGASEKSIRRLWNQIIVPTLNAKVGEVSVHMGLMILKRVLLDKQGGRLGRLDGSMSKIGDSAVNFIENHGGEVRGSSPVEAVELKDEGRHLVQLKDDNKIGADLVLSAVPGHRLEEVLTDSALNRFSCPFWDLEWNSIINVHLFFREDVMEQDFFGFLEGTAGWVFNVTDSGANSEGHICLTLSDPGELEKISTRELVSRVRRDLASPLPRVRETELEDSVALYQPRATFIGSPGSSSLRPPQNPPLGGLYLAGDWTDTGWPATMEGAVRSGYYAAEEVLGSFDPEP
ncbi:hydroxysqualene dehydroxylase HpnE [Candidatus Bipolaricaulota bacterium]|nr:hydroxysqualene dehydroxylase HpnE [Candidatus Bipolaricaulota bacterium]